MESRHSRSARIVEQQCRSLLTIVGVPHDQTLPSVRILQKLTACFFTAILFGVFLTPRLSFADPPAVTEAQLKMVLDYQQQRVGAINEVINSVVAIYDQDRSGGGSGVVITPTGITLTNHHVIIGAGVKGWGGMAGERMYRWKLIGTDPGGDVSLIQMIPNDDDGEDFEFPFTPLGDSDSVEVGDWALAMGNPFILTEDQSPTVTLGIVSGVKRYQSGAGQNQLVYGNCIQVDSSINPGNSGGPLFNFSGEVIGINGRGSFQDRGRVNVGLGYAISSNQIKNFIPELLATKLVEHGTLDANFSDRGDKVVCSTLSVDSPAADAGLALGDEMLEFEGVPIKTANQFTNLICTLPEGWPARLKIRKSNNTEISIQLRLLGLPYARPKKPAPLQKRAPDTPPTEEEKTKMRKREMQKLLSAEPGTVRDRRLNRTYVRELVEQWQQPRLEGSRERCWHLMGIFQSTGPKRLDTWLCADGRFVVESGTKVWMFDGDKFFEAKVNSKDDKDLDWIDYKTLSPVQAKLKFEILQALALSAGFQEPPFVAMGDIIIDGADLCGNETAYRFVVADEDDDPLYFWLTGTMHSEEGLVLRKCSADSDGKDVGVLLEQWEPIAGGNIAFPKVLKRVRGLDQKTDGKFTRTLITDIAIEDFEQKFRPRSGQSEEADAE